MSRVIVAGAGRCGVLVARFLGEAGSSVTVVERLPVPGGQEPEPMTRGALFQAARRAGVRFEFGTLAVEWDAGILTTVGVHGVERRRCDALVSSTGTRPGTRGELGIVGDRGAGIVPGPVAMHLTESGVLLGHHPIVLGGGQLAVHCATSLINAGAQLVSLVAAGGLMLPFPSSCRVLTGWRAVSLHGQPRVAAVVLERGGERTRLAADAVVLADGRVPMRNVEGAIGTTPGVVPCYATADPKTAENAVDTARAAAEAVHRVLSRWGAATSDRSARGRHSPPTSGAQ